MSPNTDRLLYKRTWETRLNVIGWTMETCRDVIIQRRNRSSVFRAVYK